VHIVGGDLYRDDLVGVDPHREVQLHVPLLLAMLPLDPATGLLNLYAGGVDGDADGFIRLPEARARNIMMCLCVQL
jgi:hypothetical protein